MAAEKGGASMKRLFKFAGYDSWDRPVYKDEDGTLLVDTDPVSRKPMNLCTKCNNKFDGEPDTPIEYTKYKDDEIVVDRRVTWDAGEIDLSDVEWKDDGITRRYVAERTRELANPSKMEPTKLADAATYCATINNPYAEELTKRAGNNEAFRTASDPTERMKILQNAAKAFGIRLI
jgi:hypothetical protein